MELIESIHSLMFKSKGKVELLEHPHLYLAKTLDRGTARGAETREDLQRSCYNVSLKHYKIHML